MKGLNVLKKLFLLCSLVASTLIYADELGDILSDNKEMIFDYQFESNELESDILSKSWMNPVSLSYSKSFSSQFDESSWAYSIKIDQPIFKSGGIYYGIKYSQALRDATRADLKLQKRTMIGDAISILFNMKKTKLEQEKMKYQIKNDTIDIRQKRDSYDAGLLDSSFLDQAILKKSQDETALLQLELTLMELQQQFALLSDKDPKSLHLPKLKLMSKSNYSEANLELKRDRLRAEQADYNQKVTWAKYLPTVSVQGTYIDSLSANPFQSAFDQNYYTYGFMISMPLDINSFSDIEASKVEKLKAAVEVLDRKNTVEEEYHWIDKSLSILDKKIVLAKKDEKVYKNLYRLTKNLADAGEKTSFDADIMHNSLQIRKIDQKIYEIDKQIQLLKLYVRVENAI